VQIPCEKEAVAMGYRISVTLPGKRAESGTPHAVEIREDGVPWPIVFRFVPWREDDGTMWWRNVSFELAPAVERFDEQTTDEDAAEVDPVVLERVAAAYPAYLRIARDALAFDTDAAWKGLATVVRGRGRRGLSDDFLRRVQAEADGWRRRGERNVATRIANAYHVDRSTASRWLKRASGLKENNG
jgi:hypothetical protein